MAKYALILVAAGIGARSGAKIPKQYKEINGTPLISHTLKNASKAMNFDNTIVVLAKDDPYFDKVVENLDMNFTTVTGGANRTASVYAGLQALTHNAPDYVFIHDAARPFINTALFNELRDALETHSAAVPALPIADALKSLDGEAINRDQIKRVQTPQAFHYEKILQAFNIMEDGASYADDIAVAHKVGMDIAFTTGDERNFKVTYPEDFAKAARMINPQNSQIYYTAVGNGLDVHRLAKNGPDNNKPLWLCGIALDCGMHLIGHSDADVGLHTLTDAILGALADGDIGDHFPPEDPQWKGAASDKFLAFAADKITQRGGTLHHVDVTLICEKPKLKPHRAQMRARIAEILNLPIERVSLKATTTEKLGFTGRGEGIAAQATATVSLPNV
ncbi:MAG: bifunctional 2-C-methyl-D-erythritol 4-phosphate cytidylyltransferase/2-C-methyl-D-erythritol 2,4-cyclodiphosphate synthase [Litorimonas sp.]